MTEQEIYQYLKEHQVYADVSIREPFGIVTILIEWGDWKHDHLYCEHLMKERGFKLIDTKVTEEDGSDCYSAEHQYVEL